ncbi:thiamine-binding protein [Nocardioides jensenii]|uniref:thiamine-binding protein n=1 Tax=Nocardioides jensenii TaxID=1843 RepID=UPI000836D4C5|nr:thiamine-binding protein [Nocardioides jensenii]
MRLVAEFTTEPFHGEGEPPEHAVAALRAVEAAGLETEFGPLGTTVSGDADEVVQALADVLRSSLSHGATRVTLQVEPADG